MLNNNEKSIALEDNITHNPITYNLEKDRAKTRIVVTPVYNEKLGKPLHEIILFMIKKDAENLCN